MIFLHAALVDESLFLWGEKAHGRKGRRGKGALPPHPGGVARPELAKCSGLRPAKGARGKAVAWLPTTKSGPVPSSPVLGKMPQEEATTELAPWQIDVLEQDIAGAALLLARFADRDEAPEGITPAPSLRYCLEVIRFALSLAVREQFLPSLRRGEDGAAARWEPAILGSDREHLASLRTTMPPAVRALTVDSAAPPSRNRRNVLDVYLEGALTGILTSGTKGKIPGIPKKTNPHRVWVHGLRHGGKFPKGNGLDAAPLAEALAQWARPIADLANVPCHLCFRLEEPKEEAQDWTVRPLLNALDDPSLYIPVEDAWKRAGAGAEMARRWPPLRTHVLSELGHAAGIHPALSGAIKGRTPRPVTMDGNRAAEFLTFSAPALEQAGFRVLLPSWWTRTGTKQRLVARGKASAPSGTSVAGLSLESLVKFTWEIAIGDKSLTEKELRELANAKSPLVKIRGQWVHVSVEQIQAALEFWKRREQKELTLGEALRLKAGLEEGPAGAAVPVETVKGTGAVGKLLAQFGGERKLEELPVPAGLRATLRPYQVRGYSWLEFLGRLGLGACLADDMGLGKTMQALAMILRGREAGEGGPVLLVCPTSVLGNWQREAERFTPGLGVFLHHGPDRPAAVEDLREAARKHAILATSYTILQRDLDLLREVSWWGIVLDEAQNIKNPATRQAKAARSLAAGWRVALSGTPVENHVGELWSIMEFLNPGILGTKSHFDRRFLVPIQRERNPRAAELLRKATGPFILRRVKTDRSIIADLPDKVENMVHCQLTREQGSLYAAVLRDAQERLESSEGIERKGLVLGLISRLKQVCNHPAQFLGEKGAIGGRSGKLNRLAEMLEEILSAGDHALVFTQFTEMGSLLKPHLEERFGREVLFLHGGVPKKKRDEMVRRFQNDEDAPPVFLLSLKAGGTGLTLTRANHVFHFDRWWNPAVENQATDRAFRIGQKKNVQVHKFLCMGTMEERIDAMIRSKTELAESIVGTGEGWLTELSNQELRELVALGRDAVFE